MTVFSSRIGVVRNNSFRNLETLANRARWAVSEPSAPTRTETNSVSIKISPWIDQR